VNKMPENRNILKLHRVFILTLMTMIFLVGPTYGQEDVSDFGHAFEVFQASQDAYRRFDVSVEDVVVALPDTYRLAAGDVLQIILTGMINDVLPVQVGPQGDIYVPPAGLLNVDDMTVPEATEYVDSELSKLLINYHCSIQLVKARKIQVYLLGQVRQPGTYITLAGTTAISLIQTAGSLVIPPVTVNFDETQVTHPYFKALTSGAGRRVEVWRGGERIGNIDMADVAIRGKIHGDLVLEDGDSIFIPTNRNPVIVRGGVTRPGTYEIRNNDTVFDLIAQAGGYRSMMMLLPVQVERHDFSGSESDPELITLDLPNPDFDAMEFSFQKGDILRVPETRDQVYVLGAVWLPQAIDYHEGWNVLDYVAATGGPVMPTDESWIHVVSFPLSERQESTIFDLKSVYMDDAESIYSTAIEPGDMIWVPWENQPFYGAGLANSLTTVLGQTIGFLRILQEI